MKKVLILSLLTLSPLAMSKSPKITLRYSPYFDFWCSQQTNIDISDEQKNRLAQIFPALQNAWDKLGPTLLKKTESLMGKDFSQNEMIATVFLCKKTPSISMPLLINANWFTTYENPQPADLAADIIYHELIHTYLVDNFPEQLYNSALLKKYANEEPGVLSHIHLMALQKKVYLELGLKDRIEKVISFESESYKGAYKRSWEIVNSEGEESLVKELK